tara:strand:- start:843 stop:1286 length:444 start_codon:yes stop_codon:yes gene_type:complete
MSKDTSSSTKDNIYRSEVFAFYNVYRLFIDPVLSALPPSSTQSALAAYRVPRKMLVVSILIVNNLIIATLDLRSKLTSESDTVIVSPTNDMHPINFIARGLFLLDSANEQPTYLADLQLTVSLEDRLEGKTSAHCAPLLRAPRLARC